LVYTEVATPPSNILLAGSVNNSILASGASATLQWNAGVCGINLDFSAYRVQEQVWNASNVLINDWRQLTDGSGNAITSDVTTTVVTVYAHATDGYYKKFQVQTRGNSTDAFNSSYAGSTPQLRTNRLPGTVPGTPTVQVYRGNAWGAASVVIPGESLKVSFSAATDADGNLVRYEVAMKDLAGNWYNNTAIVGYSTTLSDLYVIVDTTGWQFGNNWKFVVRAKDACNEVGAWSAVSAAILTGGIIRLYDANGNSVMAIPYVYKADGTPGIAIPYGYKADGTPGICG
jgi:hypothetical protein